MFISKLSVAVSMLKMYGQGRFEHPTLVTSLFLSSWISEFKMNLLVYCHMYALIKKRKVVNRKYTGFHRWDMIKINSFGLILMGFSSIQNFQSLGYSAKWLIHSVLINRYFCDDSYFGESRIIFKKKKKQRKNPAALIQLILIHSGNSCETFP